MRLTAGRYEFLIDETRQEAELESLLGAMCEEIDKQRLMIRAMAYGAVGTAVIFFVAGLVFSNVLA